MNTRHGPYLIDDTLARIDFQRVHAWLAQTYWARGREPQRVEKSARHSSLVVGAYLENEQVGFMRVVSDLAVFAWISDVYVEERHRGQGLARAMVRFALDHPEHADISKWVLATRDAHRVYQELGFVPHALAGNFMELKPAPPGP